MATMNHIARLLFGLVLAFSFFSSAYAETRYVSDQLEITLRSGQSTTHQILRMLKSGSAVTVLETNSETGYTKVRNADGVEGWVLTRYLMSSPGAREQLENLQRKLAMLEIENKQLKERSGELKEQHKNVSSQQKSLEETNRQLEQDLAQIRKTAGSALALESDNNRLKQQVLSQQTELQTVQQENAALKDRSDREWFMRGAGVVIAGILIGLIIPRLKLRKRSSWDSL